MDPLSITVSTIALIQVVGGVALKLRKYTKDVFERTTDVERLNGELDGLAAILQNILTLEETSPSEIQGILQLLGGKAGPFDLIRQDLAAIDRKLITHDRGWRAVKEKLTWSFSKTEVDELMVRLERQKATISLALSSNQTDMLIKLKNASDAVSTYIGKTQSAENEEEIRKIRQWLSAPDPSTTLNSLSQQRQAGTGAWIFEHSSYLRWKDGDAKLLWLSGIPGCGKSLLTSSVVSTLLADSAISDRTITMYFFFDFRLTETQEATKMLRSLVEQLLRLRPSASLPLTRLYNQGNQSNLDKRSLMRCLKAMLEDGYHYHIVLDAIDECKNHDEILEVVTEMSADFPSSWKMFVSSRVSREIQECMESLKPETIPLQGSQLRQDIETLISHRLDSDVKLSKWPDNVKTEIKDALVEGSDNMFRWTACQLDVLRKAIHLPMLRKMLKSLPKTLDETYLRILESIDDDYFEDASRLLQLLTVSMSDLTIEEAAEYLAIDLESDTFDTTARIRDPMELLNLCGPMISIQVSRSHDSSGNSKPATESKTLRLAHYSVKEFLVSDRLRGHDVAQRFAFVVSDGHYLIAKLSLTYVNQLYSTSAFDPQKPQACAGYPALDYAFRWGLDHASYAKSAIRSDSDLIFSFLSDDTEIYAAYKHYRLNSDQLEELAGLSGMYFACMFGLPQVASMFLEAGVDPNRENGAGTGTFLQVAIQDQQSLEIVNLLIEAGADVNAKSDTDWGYAMTFASDEGSIPILKRLIEAGANVNNSTDRYTALSAAKDKPTAKFLLDAGANLDTPIPAYGNALMTSIIQGKEDVTKYLLERGADPNSKSSFFTSLGAAAFYGHASTVKALLSKGADPNDPSAESGPPLISCLLRRDLAEPCLQLLLDAGADPLFTGKAVSWGSIIGAAASAGRKDAVEMLVEKGADLKIVNRYGKNLLHFAGHCSRTIEGLFANGPKCNYPELMQFLVDEGIEVHEEDSLGQSAILAACVGSTPTSVRKMIELGGDVNGTDSRGWSCLHWAAKGGNVETVRLLIEAGAERDVEAEVETEGGKKAWEIAAYCGYEEIARELNPDLRGDDGERVLKERRFRGWESMRPCQSCGEPYPRGQYHKCTTCESSLEVFCWRCVLDLDIIESTTGHEAAPITENKKELYV